MGQSYQRDTDGQQLLSRVRQLTPLQAFRKTIAFSEGTDKKGQPTNNQGYDVICGGGLFTDYSDHPRKLIDLPRLGIKSTAAGRYQIKAGIFDAYKVQLKLKDFSPASQDAICDQLIRECKAMDDINAGRIDAALTKCKSRWASLPGAGYGQFEHKMSDLLGVYRAALAS